MEIIDNVYGKEEIKEQVLIDLINSKSVQRLKGISQFGMPDEYYYKKGYSRQDHSIGVLILLRKLGANLDEQIAGLLHDVSHTAFSHVVDWVLGDPLKEDYQDNNHLKIISNSNIPKILDKYHVDYREISNFEKFSLLEKELPSLCVDRIDYVLRELVLDGKLEIVKKIFKNLKNKNGQIVFDDVKIAEIFAREYMNLQNGHWAGIEARSRYYLLANILRNGIKNKLINKEDFMKTDNEVIELLKDSNDDYIIKKLNLLKNSFRAIECEEGVELKKKFRYIDPEVLINGKIIPLTSISAEYNSLLQKEKQNSQNYKKVRIIGFN